MGLSGAVGPTSLFMNFSLGPVPPLFVPGMPSTLFGIPWAYIIMLILVIVIIVMAALVVKFLNQSIAMATQLEKEMEYSKDMEEINDQLEREIDLLRDREEALKLYARDAIQASQAPHGEGAPQASEWVEVQSDEYGKVEAYQHYEEMPAQEDLVASRWVDFEAIADRAEEEHVAAEKEEKEKKAAAETPPPRKKAPVVAKAKVVSIPTFSEWSDEQSFSIQDIFVIYRDGRLITHLSKKIRIIDDSEIIGSMIAAIQMAVRESFKRESKGTLDALRFSDLTILMETGAFLNLAVVLRGTGYNKLRPIMRKVVKNIHEAWGPDIEKWDGVRDNVGALERIIQRDLLDEFDQEVLHKAESKTMDLSKAKVFRPDS